ncbi:HlyD family efflux transporter periplasmic adaptor subunit [Carboxylicivirga sediminis]|uniref:HlyD family efflux transporter periplasmic adaptor subunit n=1 Tax=Carboxylicivirga sediminis TaxID=2006564 RepID=A0A941F7E6_9BACT|nr:HlyD family efflux transporter periplasmic adaptor subunit [Carboxylicivirga sediminis]MBR8537997.1 HlyD family efflux transporter periplasmic adaptor subunit [Carboxylicivirga sediminis]
MLDISNNSVKNDIELSQFKSYQIILKCQVKQAPIYVMLGCFVVLLIGLFLPWTQNISTKGYVTTRQPEQHPQAIQSVISGRIEEWFVREGDFVNQGDTILHISEVKAEYFDPNLIANTTEQLEAKNQSRTSYDSKIEALKKQYRALDEGLALKRQQTLQKLVQERNKSSMDSIDLEVFRNNLAIAVNQYSRTKELYDKGLKTLSELQEKQYKKQEAEAKVSVQQNKWINQQNTVGILTIELLAIEQEYTDKLAKSQSDLQSAISAKMENEATIAKLKSTISNYSMRQQYYYLTAPQSGYVTKILRKGIGETIKEGSDIAIIVPDNYDLAVEVYLKPNDLPLLHVGNSARLRFDGWPAIVISGWPQSSTGVFNGTIVAIDQYISDNGHYRVLISPEVADRPWPEQLRVGAGTEAFLLLNKVPVWYELWRQLNGFPPDFYQSGVDKEEVKLKAPIKSIK